MAELSETEPAHAKYNCRPMLPSYYETIGTTDNCDCPLQLQVNDCKPQADEIEAHGCRTPIRDFLRHRQEGKGNKLTAKTLLHQLRTVNFVEQWGQPFEQVNVELDRSTAV